MPLALDLPQNVDAVVVPKGPRHLVVVHGQVILLDTPEFGQTSRIDDLEDTRISAFPRNVTAVPLGGIIEKLLQEVPQEPTI